jgi:hypothetical protein
MKFEVLSQEITSIHATASEFIDYKDEVQKHILKGICEASKRKNLLSHTFIKYCLNNINKI